VLGQTHLILNIDECQMQGKEALRSVIRACKRWRSDGISVIPKLSGQSTSGTEVQFQQSRSLSRSTIIHEGSEENVMKEMIETIFARFFFFFGGSVQFHFHECGDFRHWRLASRL